MQFMRMTGQALSIGLILSVLSVQALGHSALKGSFPAKGSELNVRPDTISLEFNGPVRLVKFDSRWEQSLYRFFSSGRTFGVL